MFEYKGYIAIDFDATLASYVRPFEFDKLGKPQHNVIEAIKYFYKEGYHINIFTGRVWSKNMEEWLKKYEVPFHTFNQNPKQWDCGSTKPSFDVLLDDKAVNVHWKHNKKLTVELIDEIKTVLKWSKEGK